MYSSSPDFGEWSSFRLGKCANSEEYLEMIRFRQVVNYESQTWILGFHGTNSDDITHTDLSPQLYLFYLVLTGW